MNINDIPSDVLMLAEELFPTEEGFARFYDQNRTTTVEGKVDWVDLTNKMSTLQAQLMRDNPDDY